MVGFSWVVFVAVQKFVETINSDRPFLSFKICFFFLKRG